MPEVNRWETAGEALQARTCGICGREFEEGDILVLQEVGPEFEAQEPYFRVVLAESLGLEEDDYALLAEEGRVARFEDGEIRVID